MVGMAGQMVYKVSLFIGRFQPFHNGHLYSLNKCLEIADRVIVGIGSSQESGTDNNPWDYDMRKRMVGLVMSDPSLQGSSSQVEVVAIPDVPNDAEWVENVERMIRRAKLKKVDVVVVSNNEWVTELLGKAGFPIYKTGLFNREELEGVKIRQLIRNGSSEWEKRVPKSVVQLVGKL